MIRILVALGALGLALAAGDGRADTVTFRSNGRTLSVEGNVLAKDSLGNMQFEGRDTQQYFIRAAELVSHEKSSEPVPLYTTQQLRKSLEKEFGASFKFIQKKHYLICYNCSPEYAKNSGELFERAFQVFTNYFKNKGNFRFVQPRQPLVAIIFGSREEYIRMLQDQLGPGVAQTAGVYVPATNRMFMYDAFGGRTGRDLQLAARVNQRHADGIASLLREQNVSVVIHEAVHQIAYNVGFHNRSVSNPLWLVEGMAMYFEAPDLDSKGGWKGVGEINRERLEHFQRIFPTRAKDSLHKLVVDDARFRDSASANDAYAEAWALTYFLARTKTTSYVRYLRAINERDPATSGNYTPEERLRDFRNAFGKNPDELEIDFRRYMARVNLPR